MSAAVAVIHELPLERRTLHGHFSRDLPPVLTVEPGDTVRFSTLDSSWGLDAPLPQPPRVWGGNIDCNLLLAGATLFLPIPVDGALFSAGDGHARQGDGEVSQLAIECPLERVELTLDVRDDLPLSSPIAWTPEAWIT